MSDERENLEGVVGFYEKRQQHIDSAEKVREIVVVGENWRRVVFDLSLLCSQL